jgi:CBS domain-containing protein
MLVGALMSKNVKTLERTASVKEAAQLMKEYKISSVLILDGDKVEGIVRVRDIICNIVAADKQSSTVKVEDIMTRNVIAVTDDMPIEEAAKIMTENKIKTLPVFSNGKLAGIITATDIVASGVRLEETVLASLANLFPVQRVSAVGS